jgi:hypothetical protein
MKEVWRRVKGFKNYKISNYGRLFSVKLNRNITGFVVKYAIKRTGETTSKVQFSYRNCRV